VYCLQYPELSKVYKFLLTIPLTQVSCERAFSELKLIKSKLRSSLTNENLESLLVMHSEADILNSIDSDTVIDYLCQSRLRHKKISSSLICKQELYICFCYFFYEYSIMIAFFDIVCIMRTMWLSSFRMNQLHSRRIKECLRA